MTQYATNPIIRERAKNILHRNLGRIIVMNLLQLAFIAVLVPIPFCLYGDAALNAMRLTATYSAAFMKAYPGAVLSTWKPLFCLIGLLIAELCILLPWLTAGYRKALIEMARGVKPSIGTLFCRFRHFFGCIGLDLWITVKLLLWTLPTFGLLYLIALVGVITETTPLDTLPAIVVLIPLFACIIPASFRYSMARHFYADDPAVGVFGAVRKSKEMMRYRKCQLFRLTFLYALLSSVISDLSSMISDGLASSDALVASILCLVISLAALLLNCYLYLRTEMSQTCFYEAYHIRPE